jgi:hypothetical protein
LGYLCTKSKYGKQLRFQNRASEKLNKELDICRIIQQQRRSQVQLWSLMNDEQRALSIQLS